MTSAAMTLPTIGLGTNTWRPDLLDLDALASACAQAGPVLIDTAEVYGRGASEKAVGRLLRLLDPADFVVATKVMPMPWRRPPRAVVEATRASLRRLGVPHLDLLYLHFPANDRWLDGLADAWRAGLTQAVGLSNHDPAQLRHALDRLDTHGVPVRAVQVEFSLLRPDALHNGVMDLCRERDLSLVASRPLANGLLVPALPRGLRARHEAAPLRARANALAPVLSELARTHDVSPADIAIAWVLAQGAVPIPGTRRADRLRANLGAKGLRLDEAALQRLVPATS